MNDDRRISGLTLVLLAVGGALTWTGICALGLLVADWLRL